MTCLYQLPEDMFQAAELDLAEQSKETGIIHDCACLRCRYFINRVCVKQSPAFPIGVYNNPAFIKHMRKVYRIEVSQTKEA